MKKLHLFFTILLMLGIGLLNPLQAQSQMVKTLDDPGSSPVAELTLPEYQTFRVLTFTDLKFNDFEENYYQAIGTSSDGATSTLELVNSELASSFTTTITINGVETEITGENFGFNLNTGTPTFRITTDSYELSQNNWFVAQGYEVFGSERGVQITFSFRNSNGLVDEVDSKRWGTNGTPITFTAEELAALNDANGRSFIMKQTATNATSIVNIPAQADAAAIGQAIKTAGIPHTIYIQPEIQDDGSLEIYADESFTLEGDPILSSPLQISSKQNEMLYPNPTSELLHLDHNTAKELDYVVYDLTGKRVQSTTCSGTKHVINVSPLAPGVYVLEAHTSQQKNQWRFVKE